MRLEFNGLESTIATGKNIADYECPVYLSPKGCNANVGVSVEKAKNPGEMFCRSPSFIVIVRPTVRHGLGADVGYIDRYRLTTDTRVFVTSMKLKDAIPVAFTASSYILEEHGALPSRGHLTGRVLVSPPFQQMEVVCGI